MTPAILSSTFLLTLLLGVGLFFFLRASVKDRTLEVKLLSEQPEESLLSQLQQYFTSRAYRVAAIDGELNAVTFEGFVQPSWFLALFLTLLAAVGTLSLALVLGILFPQVAGIFLVLVATAPAAGFFYWQKAGRIERVRLQLEPKTSNIPATQSLVAVTAHRDEIEQLIQTLPLKPWA